jgi:anti-sigma factor RsiW
MPCDEWRNQLDTYLDGELSAEPMRAMDTHLRTCPSCAADALAHVQFKRALKGAGARYTPSPQLREKIQRRIAGKPRRSWNLGWAIAAAGLAIVLIGVPLGNYVLRQNLRQQHFYSELADMHISTLASSNPVDVVSSDRHTVKPWFQGRIPFTFNMPELQNTDFTLLGGRVTYLGQVPGAQLIYQIRKHQISVFIFPEDLVRLRDPSKITRERSFNAESWRQDSLRYIVLSDVSSDDLHRLTLLLKAAARG